MKIRRISTWKEDLALTKPYTIAYERISVVENVFVEIEADNGMTGLGAASPAPEVTGETVALCQEALDRFGAEALTNGDIRYYRTCLRNLGTRMKTTPAALAALDIAIHDLVSQALALPLVDVLGRVHDRLPTSVTIGIKDAARTLADAEEYYGQGFRVLKVKTGNDPEADIERLVKLREKFGNTLEIRVDANQGYTRDQYLSFHQQTRALDLEFVEQPLASGDIDGMRSFPGGLRRWTAADESLLTPSDAVNLLCPPAPFGIFVIKLMKCGGIAPAMDIATMAGHGGIDLMWGCNDESVVSITAALHAALASPATRYLDLDGSLDLAKDVAKGGFKLENGQLSLTGSPGLGLTRLY